MSRSHKSLKGGTRVMVIETSPTDIAFVISTASPREAQELRDTAVAALQQGEFTLRISGNCVGVRNVGGDEPIKPSSRH